MVRLEVGEGGTIERLARVLKALGIELLVPEVEAAPADAKRDTEHAAKVMAIKDRQGKNRELKISSDGSIFLETLTGLKKFDSVDAVREDLA